MKYVEKIINCASYNEDPVSSDFELKYLVDSKRSAEIRSFFKKNTELDLDSIALSKKSTWEKSIEIASFIAKNIPHDNQKEGLKEKNAITLWEYSRRISTGFNCRWHSILLSELLLSIGIRNRFITCSPENPEDNECHVVNLVWLPELKKYAMIDSDMKEYVTDEKGIPLSLREMRLIIKQGKKLIINPFPDFESYTIDTDSFNEYWSKNLYWFSAHTVYGFDLEGRTNPEDNYVCLVPPGYDCSHHYIGKSITSNEKVFWDEI